MFSGLTAREEFLRLLLGVLSKIPANSSLILQMSRVSTRILWSNVRTHLVVPDTRRLPRGVLGVLAAARRGEESNIIASSSTGTSLRFGVKKHARVIQYDMTYSSSSSSNLSLGSLMPFLNVSSLCMFRLLQPFHDMCCTHSSSLPSVAPPLERGAALDRFGVDLKVGFLELREAGSSTSL